MLDYTLYQDNQSAIRLERNGRKSCTGNSRHISVRYFFVKDRVDKGEVSIKYCPTSHMLADFFTKPLQGKVFELFCDVLMGRRPLNHIEKLLSTKERVKCRNKLVDKKRYENRENTDHTRKAMVVKKCLTYADCVKK